MAFTGEFKSAIGSGGESACVKSTAFNRLANAVDRLDVIAGNTVDVASRLTGGWPSDAKPKAPEQPNLGGHFGEIESAAEVIHRICDRLDEANSAVMARLP